MLRSDNRPAFLSVFESLLISPAMLIPFKLEHWRFNRTSSKPKFNCFDICNKKRRSNNVHQKSDGRRAGSVGSRQAMNQTIVSLRQGFINPTERQLEKIRNLFLCVAGMHHRTPLRNGKTIIPVLGIVLVKVLACFLLAIDDVEDLLWIMKIFVRRGFNVATKDFRASRRVSVYYVCILRVQRSRWTSCCLCGCRTNQMPGIDKLLVSVAGKHGFKCFDHFEFVDH